MYSDQAAAAPTKPAPNRNEAAAAAQDSVKRTIYTELQKMKPDLERALPAHLGVDRMLQLAFTSLKKNPKLLDCTPQSLLGAVMQAAQLGLEPDVLGSAYLVPFKNKGTMEVQLQIGYKGLIELVRRSGEVTSIVANEVRKNDRFEYEYGLNEKLRHIPAAKDRGEIEYFYAYARFKDGGYAFTVMSVEDVNEIRDKFTKSKDRQTGAIFGTWADHYEAMAKKTVIKQLIKYMPISVEVQRQVSEDGAVRSKLNEDPVIIDMEPNV